jgi:hypothetical protein
LFQFNRTVRDRSLFPDAKELRKKNSLFRREPEKRVFLVKEADNISAF